MASSLLTVTLNPAVDKTYLIPEFALDGVNRPQETRVTAGGKGINVARVYEAFGGTATATGFLGGGTGERLQTMLASEDFHSQFLPIAGETRSCIKIIGPAETQTEINEAGPDVIKREQDAFIELLRELLPGRSAVVISGSIPRGVPASIYRDIVHLAQDEFGIPAVLDASGDAFRLGMEARPFLAKPNLQELAAVGIVSNSAGEAARLLYERCSPTIAIVTAGAQGAAVWSADGGWEATPPEVRVESAVGSGDALAAGFAWALHNGNTIVEALVLGVSAGAANAMSYGAGCVSRMLIAELAAQTHIQQIGV